MLLAGRLPPGISQRLLIFGSIRALAGAETRNLRLGLIEHGLDGHCLDLLQRDSQGIGEIVAKLPAGNCRIGGLPLHPLRDETHLAVFVLDLQRQRGANRQRLGRGKIDRRAADVESRKRV